MKLEEKAQAIVEIRKQINDKEEALDLIIGPLTQKINEAKNSFNPDLVSLKEKKEVMDLDIISDMDKIGFKSVKIRDGRNITVAEKPFLRIEDKEVTIKFLKRKKLTDYFETNIKKSLFSGYAKQMMKENKKIPGTINDATRYISITKGSKK